MCASTLPCELIATARLYSNAQGSTGSSAPLRKVDCVQAGCGGWTLACEKMLQRHDTSCMVNATAQLAPTVPLLVVMLKSVSWSPDVSCKVCSCRSERCMRRRQVKSSWSLAALMVTAQSLRSSHLLGRH
eukprot:746463-Hanusia_phi.AAC.8